MGAILGFLTSAVGSAIGWAISKMGLQVAIGGAVIAAWLGLIVTFTLAMSTCFETTCGGMAVNWSGLHQWVKFGLSLVPAEIGLCIVCLLSARAAAWYAIVVGRIMRTKAASGTGIAIPGGRGLM